MHPNVIKGITSFLSQDIKLKFSFKYVNFKATDQTRANISSWL